MKNKETLEEAAEEYSEKFHYAYGQQSVFYQIGFKEGAKWQAERMYSEEDMRDYAIFYYTHQGKATKYWGKDLFKEWFEQFKKK